MEGKITKVNGYGGFRENSGRKLSLPNSCQVNWRVTNQARQWVADMAKEQGVTIGVMIERLIESYATDAFLHCKPFRADLLDYKSAELAESE